MTEIPEHLLKRSRDRRAALGLGGDDSGAEAAGGEGAAASSGASATPATTTAATPAATGPAPPPPPDPPYVAAAKRRSKIPFWAMGALSILPIWMFMYVRALTEEEEDVAGPLGEGAEVYGSCSSCHGGVGEGGVGRAFAGGEVLATFPHIEDQLRFVYWGTAEYQLAGVEDYGNPEREDGPHLTGSFGVMPAQGEAAGGSLTDAEILAVICHERYTLGGADPTSEEYLAEYEGWCSEEAPAFVALEEGTTLAELADAGLTNAEGEPVVVIPVGDAPAPGSPPG